MGRARLGNRELAVLESLELGPDIRGIVSELIRFFRRRTRRLRAASAFVRYIEERGGPEGLKGRT
jgi:hypothetical protein